MEKDQLEEIALLNERVLTRIAPSKVQGVGVFAMRDIPKGTILHADAAPHLYKLRYEHFDKLREEVRELLLERWPQVVNGSNFLYPDMRIKAFMNHSGEPNYSNSTDIVIKDIQKGEEIFEDYRVVPGYSQVYPFLT